MGQGENGPAFSETAMISAKNMSGSSCLEARDQLKQVSGDVRLVGIMGSHPSSPTNLGGGRGFNRGGGAGGVAARRWACFCRVLRVFGPSCGQRAFSQRSLVGARGRIFTTQSALWWLFWGESVRDRLTDRERG